MPKLYPRLRQGIIKSENPLPRHASGQKSLTGGQTDGQTWHTHENVFLGKTQFIPTKTILSQLMK